jgi:hypothetical protein
MIKDFQSEVYFTKLRRREEFVEARGGASEIDDEWKKSRRKHIPHQIRFTWSV